MQRLDVTDVKMLRAITETPRMRVSDLAERTGVARNTAQARIERLAREGMIGSEHGVNIRSLGFGVQVLVSIQLQHAEIDGPGSSINSLRQRPNDGLRPNRDRIRSRRTHYAQACGQRLPRTNNLGTVRVDIYWKVRHDGY